jgi:hypothetical protein
VSAIYFENSPKDVRIVWSVEKTCNHNTSEQIIKDQSFLSVSATVSHSHRAEFCARQETKGRSGALPTSKKIYAVVDTWTKQSSHT